MCTGNVKSTGDSPIFSVSVARATAHTEAEMVWRFPGSGIVKERDQRGGIRIELKERERIPPLV